LAWALRALPQIGAVNGKWADLHQLRTPPQNLAEKILKAAELYPCDLLFIHRDADRQPPDMRYREIDAAVDEAWAQQSRLPAVCVVPVRMSEAWLLFDEPAIRQAASNPRGKIPLTILTGARVEQCPDPKDLLLQNLRDASETSGRRLKQFRQQETQAVHRVVANIRDFSPLRQIPAFARLEHDLKECVEREFVHMHNVSGHQSPEPKAAGGSVRHVAGIQSSSKVQP
jgi:hypothetical protein